ncbi:hypothetical protein [Limnofasciculus baicalensis]|uniref:Uncharacterized protein n=1 Tax=Limnofasciculus baicalensis BBK-W-15 TaxID=2699891 RepID=A0AAE3GV16_9CYAN|nr:hypothetical protein [Limnofasciculus baicalensis]MCP2730491.1 hypothetical protein [Limnofasciculus baicalensis BBK-W-15]
MTLVEILLEVAKDIEKEDIEFAIAFFHIFSQNWKVLAYLKLLPHNVYNLDKLENCIINN